jgi:hypothetical protein
MDNHASAPQSMKASKQSSFQAMTQGLKSVFSFGSNPMRGDSSQRSGSEVLPTSKMVH